jgi:sugar phosphate isomerase/epimerase
LLAVHEVLTHHLKRDGCQGACWGERALADTITAGIDRIRLVQLSDYLVGTLSTPDRAVPGDGDIPFDRIVGRLLAAGYEGAFDLGEVEAQLARLGA